MDHVNLQCGALAAGVDGKSFEDYAQAMPYILWRARPDGIIDYFNQAFTLLTGIDPQEDQQNWTQAVHPDDLPYCQQQWERSLQSGSGYTIEFRLWHAERNEYHWYSATVYPVKHADDAILCWYGACVDIHESKQSHAAIHDLSKRLSQTLESMTEAFYLLDRSWRFTYVNQAAEVALARPRSELLGHSVWEAFPEAVGSRLYTQYHLAVWQSRPVQFQEFYPPLDRWFEVTAYPAEQGLSVYFRDISQRKNAERELEYANRALLMLSKVNEALLHKDDETALLNDICQLARQSGDYRAAWVGYAGSQADKVLEIVAWAGEDDPVTAGAGTKDTRWDSTHPTFDERVFAALHNGLPVLLDSAAPDTSGQKDIKSPDADLKSGVSLPLCDDRHVFGVLVLLNKENRAVSAKEVAFLQDLAKNLGRGIRHIRAQKSKRRMERAMVTVANTISASTGLAYFQALARSIADAIGADAVYISRLVQQSPKKARTLAVFIEGQISENFTYEVDCQPCQDCLQDGSFIVQQDLNLSLAWLTDARLGEMQSMVGQRLANAKGEPLGTLFAFFKRELRSDSDFMQSLLPVFAARAAAEIERQHKDAHIHYQASLLDKARDAIVVSDMNNRVTFWNKGAERLYGWSAQEIIGLPADTLLYENFQEHEKIIANVKRHGDWTGEQVKRRKDGATVAVECSWTLVCDEEGQPQSVFSIHTDISGRKAAEKEIQRLAFYDQLTGLPNRLLLHERLQHAISVAHRNHKHGAVMFLDLDQFKELNDVHGHDKGDLLLKQVAQRLLSCVRDSDTVARLGGDEFVVILENLSEESVQAASHARTVAKKILATLNLPYDIDSCQHICTPSIGVVLFDGVIDNTENLLKCGDLAMYKAKASGRNAIRFYDPDMQAAVIEKVALANDLRESEARGELSLHYQPQVNAQGMLIGVEALLRWSHPIRGQVPPSTFIPVAEEAGLILKLGRWVLHAACEQLRNWSALYHTLPLTLSINVSAYQFRHPDFVSEVIAAVTRHGIEPRRLKLELTESMLVEDVEEAIEKMNELQAYGVEFALDDFGTGYSSLSYLRRLPLRQLKIDQSFLRDVPSNENDVSIVEAIIAMGKKMGLCVIAEGVETQQQLEFLTDKGCTAYQGYLISRPLAASAFQGYLSKAFFGLPCSQ